MREKDLVKVIKDYLEYQEVLGNLYYIRNNTGAVASGGRFIRFGKKGSSDFILFLPNNQVYFIEAKSTDGDMSLHQLKFQDTINKLGYDYYIVRSLDELMAIIGHKD